MKQRQRQQHVSLLPATQRYMTQLQNLIQSGAVTVPSAQVHKQQHHKNAQF
jgi:hypothetical protein